MHRFVLHNGEIQDAAARFLSPGQIGVANGWGVFSTLRVIDGVLFAFERHWERMKKDAEILRVPFPDHPVLMLEPLDRLIAANGAAQSTLRVMVFRNHGGAWEGPGIERDYDLVAFTADVKRWGENVKLGLAPNGRHAGSPFSGAKILSWSHNLVMLEEAQSRGFDEVILLNEHGLVSECTSANVFVSEGNRIWTPPLAAGCLPGVTRRLLLEEISVEGVEIGEKDLNPSDLERADDVFITSTTRGLKPVASVEGLRIQHSGSARQPVQAAFSDYVREYVASAKSRQTSVS